MQVEYHPEKIGRKAGQAFDGILLSPGVNNFASETVKQLLNHRSMPRFIQCGAIVFLGDSDGTIEIEHDADPVPFEPDKPRVNLLDLTIEEAKPIIDTADSIDVLTMWAEADRRVGIADAIDDRIDELANDELRNG